jgi:hypothetical protein
MHLEGSDEEVISSSGDRIADLDQTLAVSDVPVVIGQRGA